MNQTRKKVQQAINENILTLEDIQTRKEYWKKPSDEDYFELKIYTGWKWWDKDYKFLPIPDTYQQIKEQTLAKLKELPSEEYFIIRNRNNVLTIVFQNKRQLDLERPDIVIFFGANPRKPELEERLWRLYFITSIDYIDNQILYCQITAQKDYFWKFYGNLANSKGTANITTSNLGYDHAEHKEDWNQQSAYNCPACEMCFDFCGDLRNKRATPSGFKSPKLPTWQPQFKLMYTYGATSPGAFKTSSLQITNDQGETIIAIPNNIRLKTWQINMDLGSLIRDSSGIPTLLFLVAKEHNNKKDSDAPFSDPIRYPKEKNDYIWEELPECYWLQPHLLNHSSAQFYFQKKVLFTANLRHLHTRKKDNKWQLGYRILIRSSIAGILYCFESGEIFYKWELKVQGSIINTTFLNTMIGSVLKGAFAGSLGGAFKGAFKGLLSGGIAGAFGGAIKGGVKGAGKGSLEGSKTGGNNLSNILTGQKYEKLLGLEKKQGKGKDAPENEQQTERQKKSTAKSQNRIVEPGIFYANTVDFDYDFWEFANRSIANPFQIKFEHSEVLYNNLYNNNNKSPLQNIQCRFSAFKQLIKIGNFQGQVNLLWDIDNWFSGVCNQGTYFYDKLEELFKPWQPRYKILQSFTHGDTFNSGVGVGEEEVEIIEEEVEEVVAEYDKGKAHASYQTYFRTEDESLFNAIVEGLGITSGHTTYQGRDTNWNEKAPDKKNASCWGCVISSCEGKEIPLSQGGVVYTYFDQDQSEEIPMELPTDQEYILKVGNGQFIVKTKEKTFNTRFKFERIKQEKEEEYKEQEFDEPVYDDKNTQFNSNIGEVDPHELPSLDKDTEMKETNKEEEQKLTEKSGDTEKLFEKQLEFQKEKERVRELERQLEKELEREKETKQKEIDLEREKKLKDAEVQAEKERKQREVQFELDKKEKERLDREAKTRERLQQQERERKERERKEKEKKEKE